MNGKHIEGQTMPPFALLTGGSPRTSLTLTLEDSDPRHPRPQLSAVRSDGVFSCAGQKSGGVSVSLRLGLHGCGTSLLYARR